MYFVKTYIVLAWHFLPFFQNPGGSILGRSEFHDFLLLISDFYIIRLGSPQTVWFSFDVSFHFDKFIKLF
jgi:hypothetical protein